MLQNTSVQGLTASGKTWLSNTSITGQTDINVTGTATTTIGGTGNTVRLLGTVTAPTPTTSDTSVATTAYVNGQSFAKSGANTNTFSSLQTLSGGLTLTGATKINETGSGTTIIGSSSSATTALNSVATTVGGTLGVTGTTTLANVSCTSLGINKTNIVSSGADPVMVVKPQEGSNQGALELGNKYGLYNLPYSQGTTVTDGGFTFRANTLSGANADTLLRIQNIPPYRFDLPASGVNIETRITYATDYAGGSLTQTGGYKTLTNPYNDGATAYGMLNTNTTLISGVIYKVCLKMSSVSADSIMYIKVGSTIIGDYISLGVGTSPSRIHTIYFKATTTGNLLFDFRRFNSLSLTIVYDFFSIDTFYETTASSLNVTGPIRASGPCDFITTTSAFTCPTINFNNTAGTQTANVRYTPINSNSAYVNIELNNITEFFRGIIINTTQFPLLAGLSPIPVFIIPIYSVRGMNVSTVDGGLSYVASNIFLANRATQGGWYAQQLSGSSTMITLHTSAYPTNSNGAATFSATRVDTLYASGIIGV